MRKLILILLIFISSNKAYENNINQYLDKHIINDLTLIKNTYEYVNNSKVRDEMIRRQNKIIYNEELRILYERYLIKVE